jgi:molybdate transport system permease protein
VNEDVTFPLVLSLVVASIATVVVALIGTLCGYVLARFKFTGSALFDALCTMPLVLPPTVIGYYLLQVLGKHGAVGQYVFAATGWSPLFTWQAAVIASIVVSFPLMVKTSRAAIESVDITFENVAYTLGKSRLQTLCQVTLPLAWKSLAAGVVLSFARALGEFGATLIVAGNIPGKTQTMPLAIYQAVQSGDDNLALFLVVLLTGSALIALLAINRLGSKW